MTTRYCDHGLYAAPVPAGTVPTAAEDGNGKAKTAATMATLVIAFTGLPSADQSITVAGVTFTAKASGATGNQFNIGADATATATNLKTAINASTTNAVQPAGNIASTAPLRNVVNATSSGGTVTVYTRCSGAEWNSVTENSTLSNCTVTQWSGGTDGAYGYVFNTAALAFPGSVAVGGYGVFAAQVPYVGVIAAGDTVKIRAAKTLTLASNTTVTWTLSALGTALSPVLFEIDDGTEWPADGSTPVFKITEAVSSTYPVTFGVSQTAHAHIKGKEYSSGARNFVMEVTGSVGGTVYAVVRIGSGADVRFESMEFASPATNGYPQAYQNSFSGTPATITTFKNCKFAWSGAAGANCYTNAGYIGKVAFVECEFSVTGASTASTGLFSQTSYSQQQLVFDGCKFTGFVTGSRLFASVTTTYADTAYRVSNCDLGNVSVWGPANLSVAVSTADFGEATRGMLLSSQYGSRGYAVDIYGRSYTEWNPAKGRPYLNAKLHDGTTPWQLYMVPSITAGNVSRLSPVEFPQIRKLMPAAADMAEAARTITLNFLLESTLSAWTKQDVSVLCKYLDTNGDIVVVDTYDHAAGALTTSSAAWSTTSWNGQTWLKREITLTTPTSVGAETEVSFVVRIHSHVANDTIGIIVDPELLVS